MFPPVNATNVTEDGIIAIGGNLDIDTLTTAYHSGIFPWPINEDYPLTWFAPDPRGILKLKDFKVTKSLKKFLNKTNYQVRYNQDFQKIISMCSKVKRANESGTWIYDQIIQGYQLLFDHQLAYCIGVYEEKQLIGGLYGVCFGELISGESMFHLKSNASKVALASLLEKLKDKKVPFIDTQMSTPIIKSFGGKDVPRSEFMTMLTTLNTLRNRDEIFN